MNTTTPEEHYKQVATRGYNKFVELTAKVPVDETDLAICFKYWADGAGFNVEREPNGDFIDYGPQVCWITWKALYAEDLAR